MEFIQYQQKLSSCQKEKFIQQRIKVKYIQNRSIRGQKFIIQSGFVTDISQSFLNDKFDIIDKRWLTQLVQDSKSLVKEVYSQIKKGEIYESGLIQTMSSKQLKPVIQIEQHVSDYVNRFQAQIAQVLDKPTNIVSQVYSQFTSLVDPIFHFQSEAIKDIVKAVKTVVFDLSFLEKKQIFSMTYHGVAVPELIQLSIFTIIFLTIFAPQGDKLSELEDSNSDDLVPRRYSPQALNRFFNLRPVRVIEREIKFIQYCIIFGSYIIQDKIQKKEQTNVKLRALQFRIMIEELGPAYIKIAQALSSRADLISGPYLNEIQRLQDKVPPYNSEIARQLIQDELDKSMLEVFSVCGDQPVASASLGQVYKAKLKDQYGGMTVAVKVQRPGVLEQVALDLHVMRIVAGLVNIYSTSNTDWQGVIDDWAFRFFQEMDYITEAENQILFAEQTSQIDGVKTPATVKELCTRKVLVSEWIDGQKMTEIQTEDLKELCNTVLNCFLQQLLETGFLHVDPHPGNLLRTYDGEVCILDYGLMTTISESQRRQLFKTLVHMVQEDWPQLVVDFQILGFIPQDVDVAQTGLIYPIGRIIKQLTQGGGARNVNIDKVIDELNDLSRRYPFGIPPFFVLVLRCFSTIEGIALNADPNYRIILECLPYLAKQLIKEDSNDLKEVLKELIYDKDTNRINAKKVQVMVESLQRFTTSGQISQEKTMSNSNLEDTIKVFFSPNGSFIQDIFIQEAVDLTYSLSKQSVSNLLKQVLGNGLANVSVEATRGLGLARFFLPVPLQQLHVLSTISPLFDTNEEDQEVIATADNLYNLYQSFQGQAQPSNTEVGVVEQTQQVGNFLKMVPVILPGVFTIQGEYTRRLLSRILVRVAEQIVGRQ